MEKTNIRKLDELGRVILPKDIRILLDMSAGDEIEIKVEDEVIILKKHN